MIMQVVVGIIINPAQKILIAQRPPDKYKGGLWEFPGCKIEANEAAFAALRRELFEELGVVVSAADSWLTLQHDYGDRMVALNTYRVTTYSGEPYGKEGQLIRWVDRSDLLTYEFPQGNRLLVDALMKA